jgi:hypothetical protein
MSGRREQEGRVKDVESRREGCHGEERRTCSIRTAVWSGGSVKAEGKDEASAAGGSILVEI